jgi:hypothetical protein
MARLPKPGGDPDRWSQLLNEYLLVAHNPDGTPRKEEFSTLAATVGLNDLNTTNLPTDPPIRTPILSNDGTNLRWATTIEINVRDYGAVGDGVTDDTAAVQAAINAAGSGLVVFPSGVFMIRGVKVNNKGTAIRGDGRFGTRIKRLSGSAPLIDMSGSGTNIGHLRYDTISNFQIDGNNMPGVLIRSYYADSCVYREVSFINCPGLAVDFVEVWDTRFENCTWEHCGSLTEPASMFRNSTAPGTFGFSEDNTNQIYFTSCRWEGFRNGAVRLDGGANGSTALLNGIFFVACKMETRVAAGPAFQVLDKTTVIFVNQLYIAIMGKDSSYAEPIDAIEDHASHLFMTNVYVQWGVAPGLANSVVHIVSSAPHMYHALGTFYPTEDPAKAAIWVEPAASDVTISSLWVNRGRLGVGNFSRLLDSNPVAGLNVRVQHPGSFRVSDAASEKELIKVDNNPTRPALHLLGGVDAVGFSDSYVTEKWRIVGSTGAARFAGNKFQIEGSKGYVGINTTPFTGIAMLIRAATEGDRGLAIVRPTSTATNRLMEFQDEAYNIQGMAIDSNGRPVAVGTPSRVTAGDQVSYANPGVQVRDIAGNVVAAVKPSPTGPGTIATVTFSRPYAVPPLSIIVTNHSAIAAELYVSARSASSFTVSTRNALPGGSLLNFDYTVIA